MMIITGMVGREGAQWAWHGRGDRKNKSKRMEKGAGRYLVGLEHV